MLLSFNLVVPFFLRFDRMIIRRYITHQVSKNLLMLLAVLLFIFLSMQWMDFLGDVVDGKLSIGTVLRLMGLQAPFLFGLLLPLAFFLGVLLTHGRLAMDHEMIALYACGMSHRLLRWITLRQALLISFLVALFVLVLQPEILQSRDRVLEQANKNTMIESLVAGQFQKLGAGHRVLYAEQISPGHHYLNHVFMATSPHQDQWEIVTADQAFLCKCR
jgi:lipopolysaccharide export system permease protein